MQPSEIDLNTATPIERIRYLMARLREPDYGCPWDIKQTHRSILPFTIEEAYEVADAIERNDLPHLCDELGDLLFQVVFYTQMAEEAGEFAWNDVLSGLEKKLVRRHPHVFPLGTLESRITPGQPITEERIKSNWEAIKQQEKGPQTSVLDDIPRNLAPLKRSQKLQKSAAKTGFDWSSPQDVMEKLAEETAELQEVVEAGDREKIADELGDMLFVLTNLARHYKLDAEALMLAANAKFERRFRYVEQWAAAQGFALDNAVGNPAHTQGGDKPRATLDDLENGWRAAKQEGL